MSGVSSELSKMCISTSLIHILRNCREISELAGIFLGYQIENKMVYFRVWGSDQHSDATITLPLESSGISSDIFGCKYAGPFFDIKTRTKNFHCVTIALL